MARLQLLGELLMGARLAVAVVVLLAAAGGVGANVMGQGSADAQNDDQGLYGAGDLVTVLNVTNFKEAVRDSDRAWLVEFYNSWCGFCKRFAPIWKELAKSVHGWRSIVTIAAIDCANDDNNPLCREFEIMKYPTLKFFPVNANQDFLGLEITKDKDETIILHSLVDQLEKEQQEQRGGPNWPNIVPYRGTELEALWHGAPSNIKYEILIFEEANSYLGAPVILDLHKIHDVRIRRVTKENEFLCVTTKVTKFPSVVALDRNHNQIPIKVLISTREGVRSVIEEFLKLKGISIDIKEDDKDNPNLNVKLPLSNNLLENPTESKDKVYQLDLETTLRYSLNNEIPLSPRISGEKLKALKEYLKVLSNYFPVHMPKGKMYLQILTEIVGAQSNLTGREFKEHVKINEKGLAPVYSGSKKWIGCKGSTPTFRGYPCGLWTMFHTLTVIAADYVGDNHPTVLTAMHGYVKNFFGCADCAEHFQEMAKKRKLFEAQAGDESILWLWRAHNEVNERLAGDPTEDPEHKKIQYPSDQDCPRCKLSDGKWDETEVLKYLKFKYSKPNIDLSEINNKLVQKEIETSASNSSASHRKIGWDFTIFDISICVVLYVTSAAILILVCIKFAYKRTSKKKVSLQHLFGFA